MLGTSITPLLAQDELDITKEVADPQSYIFTDGKTTVQGYIYSMLAKQSSCCDKDDIYLEVKIDPTGYVVDAKALTGKNECYKQSIIDIVRNIKWKNNDIKAQRSVFFPVKPLKACTGEEGENQYKPIPVTNNPINNKTQVASSQTTDKPAENSIASEYAQREREKKEREEAQKKAQEEAERRAQEEAQKKSEEMMADNSQPAETSEPAGSAAPPEKKSEETTSSAVAEDEQPDPETLNKFALESDEERLAREAAEAKAFKEEEARLLAEAEADSKKQAEAKAKKQAELKSKKDAELKNKKAANEQEMRARIEAELRAQLKAELEEEMKKSGGSTKQIAEADEETDNAEPVAPKITQTKPPVNKFSKYPGYESTGDKNPDASHRGSHLNTRVPEFTTPQFIEQSGASLYIKNKLKEGGICGLAQSVAEVAVDRSGNVISHRIFKCNTEKVEGIMPGILNGMKFKPESIRYNGQLVYVEFKADIFCPSTPTKGIDLDQVQDYLQVTR